MVQQNKTTKLTEQEIIRIQNGLYIAKRYHDSKDQPLIANGILGLIDKLEVMLIEQK